ncbi:MAG: HAMP domain-containing histidine kinase [Synergistaceae bacterium]|nr:HAMP domain-containing histidine kinase [Synergistaceae bacterium]
MKIRTRITLFVVLSGLAASLLLSTWLIGELLEQPFRFLDKSLQEESERAVRMLSHEADIEMPRTTWMEIRDAADGKILYRSQSAEVVGLNSTNSEAKDFEKRDTRMTALASIFRYLRGVPGDRTIYRTKIFEIAHDGGLFLVRIARPMDKLDKLEEGIQRAFWTVAASLIFVVMALIAIGRVVAGKILRPVKNIMALARNISDKNLTERIPVGRERDEHAELSETLNRMLDRLQFSFARQKEFLFDTSHELKTPLTTIRMAVEEMNAEDGFLLPKEARDNLSRMESQVIRMERLVKDLLSLSALEALPNVERNPVRVDVLLSSLIDEYRFWADAENIRVETEIQEGLVLLGDEEKLRRSLSNAMDNAIKYNEEQAGERLITVRAFESPEALTIIVSNTGEALSMEESRRVFDQFYRVGKTQSSRRGGSGLGLAIIKKTVELHQGEARFESATTESRNMNRLILSFSSAPT